MAEKATEAPVTRSDTQWLQRQIDDLYKADRDMKKMFRLLVRILVDKKIIGEELAKTFEESKGTTKADVQKLIEWLLK